MMTPDLLELDPVHHRDHGWVRPGDLAFAAADTRAPLLLAELPAALGWFPLAFAPRAGGGLQLVALLGLHAGENLFVDPDGRWLGGYVPSHYRGYPFSLHERASAGEGDTPVLCFDLASNLYREAPTPADQRLFADDGSLAPLVAQVAGFLRQTTANRHLTEQAVAALDGAGLLRPWSPASADAARSRPAGLLEINEAALNALAGPALAALRNVNALSIAYAQIFSRARLAGLHRRADLRAELGADRRAKGRADDDGALRGLLDDDGDGGLNFDWGPH
jgi:hypothetical protein